MSPANPHFFSVQHSKPQVLCERRFNYRKGKLCLLSRLNAKAVALNFLLAYLWIEKALKQLLLEATIIHARNVELPTNIARKTTFSKNNAQQIDSTGKSKTPLFSTHKLISFESKESILFEQRENKNS